MAWCCGTGRTRRTTACPAGEEGTFTICSFWLVSALARIGETRRAQVLFDRLAGFASPLGLYAEEIDPASGRHLGNMPQAFSHLALIGAALDLGRATVLTRPPEPADGPGATLSPMRVPGFLVRQLYVAGSLHNVRGGFSLQARNTIGDGWLVGIGSIRVDGQDIPLADITATREGDPAAYSAVDVSPARRRWSSGVATSSRSGSRAGRSIRVSTTWRSSCMNASSGPCPWGSRSASTAA